MRKIKGKLHFKPETIRLLTTDELRRAAGAISQPTATDCGTSFTEPGHLNTCICNDPV